MASIDQRTPDILHVAECLLFLKIILYSVIIFILYSVTTKTVYFNLEILFKK